MIETDNIIAATFSASHNWEEQIKDHIAKVNKQYGKNPYLIFVNDIIFERITSCNISKRDKNGSLLKNVYCSVGILYQLSFLNITLDIGIFESLNDDECIYFII
jgi:hypothetical protein